MSYDIEHTIIYQHVEPALIIDGVVCFGRETVAVTHEGNGDFLVCSSSEEADLGCQRTNVVRITGEMFAAMQKAQQQLCQT